MNERFLEIVRSRTGCAIILAGSDSDQPHVEKIIHSLEEFKIPFRVRICSAHKQVTQLMSIIEEYNQIDGALALIAVAGGTDALSGTLSFHALCPVISCPPDGSNDSSLRNPPGSSNATIVNPKNVGRFVAQLFAPFNPELRDRLQVSQRSKILRLEEKDREYQEKYRRD